MDRMLGMDSAQNPTRVVSSGVGLVPVADGTKWRSIETLRCRRRLAGRVGQARERTSGEIRKKVVTGVP